MGILGGARANRRSPMPTGRWVMVPRDVTAPVRRRTRVIQRRRRTFLRLVGVVAVTFVLGFFPSMRWAWLLHLAADGALAGYVMRLRRWKMEDELAAASAKPPITVEPALPVAQQQPGVVLPASAPPTPHAAPAEIGDDTFIRLSS